MKSTLRLGRVVVLLAGLLSSVPAEVHAQGVSPQTGITLFNGGSFVNFNSVFGGGRGLLINGTAVPDPLDRRVFAYTAPINFGYGITRDLQLLFNLPVVYRSSGLTPAGTRITNTSTGVADITLLLKYRFFKMDWFDEEKGLGAGTTQLAFTVGPKLPTGQTGKRDSAGNLLPPPLQPGSGSTDVFFALGLTHANGASLSGAWSLKRFQFTASASYKLNTEGKQNFRFGNLLELRAAPTWRPYQAKNLGPEWWVAPTISWEVTQRARAAGTPVASSGGQAVFLGFQTVFSPNAKHALIFAVDFPVFKDLNGTQLKPRPRFVFGVVRQFRMSMM